MSTITTSQSAPPPIPEPLVLSLDPADGDSPTDSPRRAGGRRLSPPVLAGIIGCVVLLPLLGTGAYLAFSSRQEESDNSQPGAKEEGALVRNDPQPKGPRQPPDVVKDGIDKHLLDKERLKKELLEKERFNKGAFQPEPERDPRPKDRLTGAPLVRAPAQVLPIKPTPLNGDKATVQVPASIADLCVGGGGRFLIMHLPTQRNLAIFDVNEGKIVKYLPLADDRVLFAAGMDKLLIVLPDKNLVQRWSLSTFERELNAPLVVTEKVFTASMGSASGGCLILGGPELRGGSGLPLRFIDVATLKEVEAETREGGGHVGTHPQYPAAVHVSADGRVLGMWNPGLSPSGLQTVVLTGSSVKSYYEHESVGAIIPGPDGRTVYTGAGLYSPECKRLGDAQRRTTGLPAAHGNFYLSLTFADDFRRDRTAPPPGVSLHMVGNDRPLLKLENLDGLDMPDIFGRNSASLSLEKRIHLIPQAQLLVTIPMAGNKIYLHRFDVDQALEKSGIDYLLVTSPPATVAVKGKAYDYKPVVKSKKGGVKLKLESGPDGMKLTDGRLTWAVAADARDMEVDVLLLVSDASGQELFHSFKIRVQDKADDVPAPPKPGDPPANPGANGAVEIKTAPAVPPVGGLQPAPLKADQEERALPGTVGAVRAGGQCRFLILHLPRERKLAIFDTTEAKVVKYLPVAEDDVKIAAGRDHLIVALPQANVLQRWSLKTLEREVSVPGPTTGTIQSLGLGSASVGPLVVATVSGDRFARGSQLTLLDPLTFKASDLLLDGRGGPHFGDRGFSTELHVSADGRVITGLGNALLLVGKTYKSTAAPTDTLPSPDGETLFSTGRQASQLFSAEGKPLSKAVGGHGAMVWYVPAVQGPFYLSLNQAQGLGRSNLKPMLHLAGDSRPLITLPELQGTEGLVDWQTGQWKQFEQHFFLIPDAQLLVVLPPTRDKLLLNRCNVDQLLEKSDADYLFMQSQPESQAARGAEYRYPLLVRSRKGAVKVKIDSAPKGMKIGGDGVLTWAVPRDFAESEAEVILSISDASGQEIFHMFKIQVKSTD
jgi:hypothetical protein